MVFVVDALAGWLVGLLADAGRKKLTNLVIGDAQERALRRAAIAAVQDTADELSPSDGQQAGQIALVINEVFRAPAPDAPLAGVVTLVERLQAGIAGQLAVLDDAGLTGTWQSSAEVLGLPGAVLADRLTGHLVREIMFRGSRGGPLTPLASQLNHDLTYLQVRRVEVQGQRVEGMLARLAEEVRDALPRSGSGAVAAGWPLDEVMDPFVLEVHRPVQPEDPQPRLPALPMYVPREHDVELGLVVRAAAEGTSGIAVLVGGSSTGKTRACWEALQLLRDQPGQWRLWHPIDPTRPDAALRELPAIGPRTVVWLNEAQFYLDVTDNRLGERVAAGLRKLLRDPSRAPVLVLATLWPEFWGRLTARPAHGADLHAQARELMAGQDITVPAAFTAVQLRHLRMAGDARLTQAAEGADDGQVIQFLAGAPELLARYRNAPPAAAALIHAAMDARRLGMGVGLPQAFLVAAAPAYLTDTEWDALGQDWLEHALDYAAIPCKGVRGPLTRIRPRPATRPGSVDSNEQSASGHASMAGVPLYRLTDYLDQHGRQYRKEKFPPAGFWAAAAEHAFPADQAALGDAAYARGLWRVAAQLHKNAAACGNLHAICYLSDTPHYLRPDVRPMYWAVAHAPLDDPSGVALVLDSLRRAGAPEQVSALAERAAAHVPLSNPDAVATLLDSLRRAGAPEQVSALAERAAAHVPLSNPDAVATLLDSLRQRGARKQVTALLHRDPAARVSLDNPVYVARLLESLRDLVERERVGALAECAQEQVAVLAERAAAHAPLDDPDGVADLLGSLRDAGAPEHITALLHRDPAAHVSLGDPSGVALLLDILGRAGAREQVAVLAERAAVHIPLGNPDAVATVLDSLRRADAREQVTALLHRDPAARVSLDNPDDMISLLGSLRAAGAQEQFSALAERAVGHVSLDDPDAVADLLGSLRQTGAQEQLSALAERAAAVEKPDAMADLLDILREAGAHEQVAMLLDRDPAAHALLHDATGVAKLLDILREAGAQEQVAVLADRAASHAPVDNPIATARLLVSLREAGAQEHVAVLAKRAAAHAPLDNPDAVARLLVSLRRMGAQEEVTTLLHRDVAAHVSLDKPLRMARLLGSLREAGAQKQATTLTERIAAHAPLHDPDDAARLLESLREEGAREQVTALLHRDLAAHVSLDDPDDTVRLLDSLREAGAQEQVTTLIDRLPGAGMFDLFRKQEGREDRFRFGRKADGNPAAPWGWDDLD